ncbi:MAG: glyoxalase superfamily protein [Pseudomonadota bacterium]
MNAPIPILRSFDEAKAKEFYLDFLGFELVFEHRFDPGAPLYFGVRLGDCRLHISEHFGDGTPGAFVRIPMPEADLRAYNAELLAKKYRNARPGLNEAPWGWDMPVADPFSNKLIFTTADA